MLRSFKPSHTHRNLYSKQSNGAQVSSTSQSRALHSSSARMRRTLPYSTTASQRLSSKVVTAFCLAISGFSLYHVNSRHTLALEARDGFEKQASPRQGIAIRNLSGWVPYTMEDVDEYLRIREQFVDPPPSSGVLRVDITQIESNSPLEDTVSLPISVIDSNQKAWVALGVFDGHW